ncbi:4-azaleucine resistance probable transporter AzlC [Desulfonispora thiosulfatigenes DSM 11270]|uniref:4-azaleucine resistance probable transporter AzlC n=1 Tax=Desulfonispora thiosulfatigenes DSM 11270 TaxID=656914 RepID=A0A1W1UJI2_DESTI|nr:AzlC family ABC transporter permease [Desulfonispora thiosulfatigenes]SMB81256.1 4-azaleucine resistance probable transporter AzlC [Desulfonispora thiosulfatigenes DSM 11270]
MNEQQSQNDFKSGAKKGIPIALGYLPIGFTFGLIATSSGIADFLVILISLTNFSATGQFASVNLLSMGASVYEIAMTTFIINSRYALMSLSLAQRIHPSVSRKIRSLLAIGITDEVFTVAAVQKEKTLNTSFLFGLELVSLSGWVLGTTMGVFLSGYFPLDLRNAMGIALYAMFIAILVPATKSSRPVLIICAISIAITSIITWIPIFSFISAGFKIIIATIIAATIGAIYFPKEVNEYE